MGYSRRSLLTLILALSIAVACTRAPGGGLVYAGPVEQTVSAGDFIPGTGIQFLRGGEKGAEFMIGDQEAVKMVGDSLKWAGPVGDGIYLQVALRTLHISSDRLVSGGTVKITVDDPNPQPGSVDESRPVRYTVPVTYRVNQGDAIPGTTIIYAGTTEGKGAVLEGIEGYPYRSIGDSIVWDGSLRANVDLHLNVRVLFYNNSFMQVGGLATVGITP